MRSKVGHSKGICRSGARLSNSDKISLIFIEFCDSISVSFSCPTKHSSVVVGLEVENILHGHRDRYFMRTLNATL